MSRWTTQASTPSLIEAWDLLKASLAHATIDDKTVVTAVEELARLKKVAAYLRTIYDSIEPDLVPLGTWAQVEEQLRACVGQVVAYNGNRSVSHISQANAHADALLGLIRPFMLTRDRAARALRSAVGEYQSLLREHLTQQSEFFDIARGRAVKHLDAIAKSEVAATIGKNDILEAQRAVLGSDEESGAGYLRLIQEAARKVESLRDEVAVFHDELVIGSKSSPSIETIISEASSGAKKNYDDTVAVRDAFIRQLDELKALHARVFGVAGAEGGAAGGLKGELEAHQKRLEKHEESHSARIAALGDKIESLLPGAASASLATAYRKMSESFDGPIRRGERLFLFSIALLVIASFVMSIEQIGLWHLKFRAWPSDLPGLASMLIPKIPIYAPLLWLAYFASARRSEAQRLQQEYAHKQALTSSYQSFKKQITDLEESDELLLRELMRKAIETVAKNASETLDKQHGDRHPVQAVVDSLSSSSQKSDGGSAAS